MENAFEKAKEKAGKEIETATPESDAALARIVSEEAAKIGPEGVPVPQEPETPIELPEFVRREKAEEQLIDKNIAERHAPEAPKAPTEEDWIKLEMQMGPKLDLDLSEPAPPGGQASVPSTREVKKAANRKRAQNAQEYRQQTGRNERPKESIDRMRNEGGVAPDIMRRVRPPRKPKTKNEKKVPESSSGPELKSTPEQAPEKDRVLEKIDAHIGDLKSISKEVEQVKKDRENEITHEGGGKKIEDKSGGYAEKYSELRMLAKQHHPTGVPEDLAAKIADLDRRYLLNIRTGRDPETQAKLAAELDSLIVEVQLPRPSYETDWPKRPEQERSAEEPITIEKDATRAENKEKLAVVIGRVLGRTVRKGLDATGSAAKAGKEKFDWYKSSSEALIRRSAELDAEAEKMGWVEKKFRWAGEKYNKLGWKSKIAIGAALGVGTIATAGLPIAYALMGGLAAQRVLGFSTMFLKYEKTSGSKEAALFKAGAYTFLMSAAIKEGIEWGSETEFGHWMQDHVRDWLAHKPSGPMPGTSPSPEAMHTMHPETPPPAVVPEAPAAVAETAPPAAAELPSVEASPGHGYEWMAKRLWEQLQEKHLDPNSFPKGSDVRTLLDADDKSIDSVVHRLALSHHFVNADGASVLIRPDAHLSFDGEGQLTGVPESAATTPAYSEAPGTDFSEGQVPNAETEMPAAETPIDAGAPTLEGTVPPAEAPYPQADLTQSAAEAAPIPEAAVQAPTPETPAPAPEVPAAHPEVPASPAAEMLYTAGDHAPIDPNVPAIYEAHDPTTGASYLAAYGGTDEQRFSFIQDYLLKPEHQGQTIRWAHEVPSITGSTTKVEDMGASPQSGSWLLKFFTEQPKAPSPDAFLRKVTP